MKNEGKTAAKWIVATMDDFSGSFATKREATEHAMDFSDTDRRPTRLGRGLYQVGRFYIVSSDAARRHGFERFVAEAEAR